MRMIVRLAVLLTLVIGPSLVASSGAQRQGVDSTRVDGAYGPEVVEIVVNRIRSRCVFSDDRLFLRRAAYVLSRDGVSPSAFRSGYNGGIWKIDEDMFIATQTCPDVIKPSCDVIESELGIDWAAVTWSDLRKPLYSGLAAALLTLIQLNGTAMPGDVTQQAEVWAAMYGEQADTFTRAEQPTDNECAEKLDLLFILDSSGSVNPEDFALMLDFTADVVDVMDVSPDVVRVADIVFADNVKVEFDFDDYTDGQDLQAKLKATQKLNTGTGTAAALDEAATLLLDIGRGARSDAKKVAVLVTDGQSNNSPGTISSALALKNKGTTVFSIGVGNYKESELRAVASQPTCSHVFTLPDFSVIRSILKEIHSSVCKASFVVTMGRLVESNSTSPTTLTTSSPGPDTKIEAVVKCGILDIYVSTSDPKPGPAVHEDRYRATDERPAVVRHVGSQADGTPLYMTVVGARLPRSLAELRNCTGFAWNLGVKPQRNIRVLCEENGVQTACSPGDLTEAGVCYTRPEKEDSYPFDNPCNASLGATRHPYPYDVTKFLQCDDQGNAYVTLCPDDVVFNPETLRCGFAARAESAPAKTPVSPCGEWEASDTSGSGGHAGPFIILAVIVSFFFLVFRCI